MGVALATEQFRYAYLTRGATKVAYVLIMIRVSPCIPLHFRTKKETGESPVSNYDLRSIACACCQDPRCRFCLKDILIIQLGHGDLDYFCLLEIIFSEDFYNI